MGRYLIALTLPLLLLGGCAVTPDNTETQQAGHVFYPAKPDQPRIQFLTTITGNDSYFQVEKSKFAQFVLGKEEKPKPSLGKPYGVALFDGKIYAVDTRGNGYVVFDLTSKTIRLIDGMVKPINITIGEDGTKYVTDTQLRQIKVFGRNDKLIQVFGVEGDIKPSDVAIIGDKLYVTDLQNQVVKVLNKSTGQVINQIGSPGSAEGHLFHPTNLAIDSKDNIYVSNTGNFRVDEFSPEGRFVRRMGQIGVEIGKFARPKGIAIDREDRIYVVDAAFQNVQVFNNEGRLLMFFGGPGVGPGQLYLPADIAIDYDSTGYFQSYAAPGFELEYLILVSNQFGPNKINVYGFGSMRDQ